MDAILAARGDNTEADHSDRAKLSAIWLVDIRGRAGCSG
jgi:hypothetical protein